MNETEFKLDNIYIGINVWVFQIEKYGKIAQCTFKYYVFMLA